MARDWDDRTWEWDRGRPGEACVAWEEDELESEWEWEWSERCDEEEWCLVGREGRTANDG